MITRSFWRIKVKYEWVDVQAYHLIVTAEICLSWLKQTVDQSVINNLFHARHANWIETWKFDEF